jgi:hypothetical protein
MRSESRTITIRKPPEFSKTRQRYGAHWLTSTEVALLLFQPDVLLASEFFEGLRKERKTDPAKKLMLAILEDAVNCLQHYASVSGETGRTLYHEARAWIMDPHNRWIFSFENVCESLDLNPDYIRDGVRRWEERRRALRAQVAAF